MERASLGPAIFVYRNAVPKIQDPSIIKFDELGHNSESSWQRFLFTEKDLVNDLEYLTEYTKPMKEIFNDYSNQYSLEELVPDTWTLLKYTDNGKVAHVDDQLKNPRIVSMVAYLNEDYYGGEIVFTHQNLMYKPNVGDVIVFPSNYAYEHSVNPVLGGIKYCIVTWFGRPKI